jgi:membrane peptidoglycan carboxypeptidase
VISQKTATTMSQMLGEVVRNGTGACASISGYTVAGKTGTSRKAAPQGGYTSGTMASFVGFAPAQDPRFAAIVVLDEPANEYGSVAAAPVFSEIVQTALTQYRVPPDDTAAQKQYDIARAHAQQQGSNCSVPHGAALTQVLAQQAAAAQAAARAKAAAKAAATATPSTGAAETPGTVAADPSQSQ